MKGNKNNQKYLVVFYYFFLTLPLSKISLQYHTIVVVLSAFLLCYGPAQSTISIRGRGVDKVLKKRFSKSCWQINKSSKLKQGGSENIWMFQTVLFQVGLGGGGVWGKMEQFHLYAVFFFWRLPLVHKNIQITAIFYGEDQWRLRSLRSS